MNKNHNIMNKKIWTTVIIAGLIICSLGGYLGFKFAKITLEKDFISLNQRVEELFQGKDVIQDGNAENLEGEETKYGYNLYSDGFTIYRLSKESGGYVKSKLKASNIAWLKDKYENTEWGRIPIYRPNVITAYSEAFSYLLSGTEKEPNLSYSRETLTEIKDFPGSFVADYYYLEHVEHPTEFYFKQNKEWHFTYNS